MATLVAACGPAPTPQVVKETVVVEKPVEVTKEVVVTAVPEPVAEGETILIGGFGPLSAPGSYQAGTEMRQAAEMAVDELNEAGGVLGKQIELIFGDTEGLPERGTAVTERLITQNGVVGIVGEYHSGVGLASMEVAHKYGIPVIFAETWGNDITVKGYPEVFRIAPTVDYAGNFLANYVAAVGWKSIVFVIEDTDYGRSQSEAYKEQLAARGITDVEIIFADPATEDFTPILQRIQQEPPEVLGGVITGIGNSRIVRQACDLGLAPTAETAMLSTVDAQYPEFWENTGDCGNYVFFSYYGLPASLWNDKTRAFLANFQERYEHQPGAPALETYDATYLLVEAIKQANSTDPQAIIQALESIQYTGAMGDYWFEYTSKNPVPSDKPAWMWHQWLTPNVFMLQYTKVNQSADEAAVVFPPERATGELYTSPK
jgi:ABC-type branched-subunit amino acid transport system substrate-binding protein